MAPYTNTRNRIAAQAEQDAQDASSSMPQPHPLPEQQSLRELTPQSVNLSSGEEEDVARLTTALMAGKRRVEPVRPEETAQLEETAQSKVTAQPKEPNEENIFVFPLNCLIAAAMGMLLSTLWAMFMTCKSFMIKVFLALSLTYG
ncbi:MAG: hypothetical protein Q9164_003158 [Protoblastenia rupestris]